MTSDPNATGSLARAHRDYYKALYQATLTISSSLELDQVLQGVVSSITEVMQTKACSLRLLEQASGLLHLGAVHGLSEGYLTKGPIEVIYSPIDAEVLSGKAVYIQDVRTDERFQYRDAARREGIVSVLCVPLEVRGETIGVMRVYTSEPTVFHDDDIKFLSVLASLSALAIENARLYENIKRSYEGVIDALWGTTIR